MDTLENTKLLRVDEAAERMNCSHSHIYNLVNSGKLCSVRFGGALRIPSTCIDETVSKSLEEWRLSREETPKH